MLCVGEPAFSHHRFCVRLQLFQPHDGIQQVSLARAERILHIRLDLKSFDIAIFTAFHPSTAPMASRLVDSFPARLDILEWAIPSLLISSALFYVIYQRFLHPIASIPGPFFASLSRLWMTKHSWDGEKQAM
jgi:hypothetical protein